LEHSSYSFLRMWTPNVSALAEKKGVREVLGVQEVQGEESGSRSQKP
jgi:hypothetical protein